MAVKKTYIWILLLLSTFSNIAYSQITSGELVFALGSDTVCQGTLIQLDLELVGTPFSTYYKWYSTGAYSESDLRPDIIGTDNGGSGNGDDHTFIRLTIVEPGDTTIFVDIGGNIFSKTITVVEAPSAGQDAIVFLCNKTGSISLFDELNGDPDTGGAWSFNGSPHSGDFVVGTDEEGIYTYLVNGQTPCPNIDARVIIRNCSNPDYDGDGVLNEDDLDDDNDGILDVDENAACSPAELTPTQLSIDEDFGIGPPTQSAYVSTMLTYQIGIPQDVNGNDGEYNVATATYLYNFGNQNAFWVSTDENNFWDGDENVDGRFLSINMKTASFIDEVIYEQTDLPVTPGVLQTLSMKIANLSTGVVPSFKLQIITTGGTVIEEVNSVDADLLNIDVWNDYTISFTPDPGVEIVNLRIINTQSTSGNGNDVGIDNILLARLECDFDLDAVPNYIDRDSDNDGIFDAVEAGFLESQVGADGQLIGGVDANGVPVAASGGVSLTNDNYLNLDSDGDGCSDANEAYYDSEADGLITSTNASETAVYGIDPFDFADIVDFDGLVLDASYTYPVDQDGLGGLDYTQAGGPDLNSNGTPDACEDVADHDEDGIPDGIAGADDLDDDNDGILDVDENGGDDPFADADSDGILDYIDTDTAGFIDFNNDGIDDKFDQDLDGLINQFDTDADGDGIFDFVEEGQPLVVITNDSGQIGADTDVDPITGIPTIAGGGLALATALDGGGLPNFLDLDADGDGIPDNHEAQPTDAYTAPSGIDSDQNGVDDVYDDTGAIDPYNTDPGTDPDFVNLNSDDDCLTDNIEAFDFDQDGVADVDRSSDPPALDGWYDSYKAAFTNIAALPNNHNPDTSEVDYREEYVEIVEVVDDPEVLCENGNPLVLFSLINTLTTNENGLWTGGVAAATGEAFDWELDPSLTGATGEYVYTLPQLGTCPLSTFTVTIDVTELPFTGLDNPSVVSACSSDTAFSLYNNLLPDGTILPDIDGTWTSADTTVLPTTYDGTIDLTAIPATLLGVDLTYTYTVGTTTCVSDTDVVINLSSNRDAGVADTTIDPICILETSTDNLFTYLTGAESGGSWSSTDDTVTDFTGDSLGVINPSLLTAGTYVYTYELAPIGSCLGDTETVEIEILAEPFTGLDNPSVIPACSSDTAFSLYNNLLPDGTVLPDIDGTWTSADTTVLPTTYDGTIDLTAIPATLLGTDLTYTYTLGATTCMSETDVVINLSSNRNAGIVNAVIDPICILETSTDNLFTYLTGAESGGSWSSTDDTVTDFTGDSLGIINPSLLAAGIYVYTYELVAIGSCLGDSETVEIEILEAPNAGTDNTEDVCFSEREITLSDYLGGTPATTGVWLYADDTEIGDYLTATVDTENITTGDEFTYKVGTDDCFVEAVVTINIIESPNPGVQSNAIVVCGSSDETVDLFAALEDADTGGTWSDSNGTIIPSSLTAGDYEYTYTLTGANGCPNAESKVAFTITSILNAGANAEVTLCRENVDIDLFDYLGADAMAGGTWISESGNISFSDDTGALNLMDTSVLDEDRYTYTVSSDVVGGCEDATAFIDLKLTEDRDAGPDPTPIVVCTSQTSSVDLFSELSITDTDGSWTGGATEGGYLGTVLITETTAPGDYTFTYTLPAIGTCEADEVVVALTIVTATTPTNPSDEEICEGDSNPLLSVTVDPGLSANWYFGTPDGPLVQEGSTTFTPTETNVGGYTYYVYSYNTATSCESVDPAVVFFTIHGIVSIELPAQATICEGESIDIPSGLSELDYNIQWFRDNVAIPGATTATHLADQEGSYYVEYESLSLSNSSTGVLCTQQSSNSTRVTQIVPASNLQLSLGGEGFSNFNTIVATFDGDVNGEYQVELDGVVVKTGEPGTPVVFENVSPGPHSVTVIEESGCGSILDGEIFVIGFPKFFTPNGDGPNEFWNVELDPSQPMNISIFVYDRFGKLIQQVFPDKLGWDGTFAGKNMPSDDYWFLATMNDTGATYASHFSLIR